MPEPKTEERVQTLDEIEQAGLEAIAAANENQPDNGEGAHPGAAEPQPKEGEGTQPKAGEKQDEPVIYTEEFDLGNGEKVTFEAESPEALREKIIAGYRELKAGKKPEGTQPATAAAATPAAPGTGDGTATPAQPPKKGRKLTTDEEFAIEQEFKTGKPLKAMRDWLQTEFGMTPEEISESVQNSRAMQKDQRERVAVAAFRKKHPDYPALNETSIDLIRRYLDGKNLEATEQTLEEAYAHFGEVLVPAKAAVATPAAPASATPAAEPGKAAPAATTPAKKVAASGIWGKQGARPPASGGDKNKKALSDAEMQKIAKEQGSDALLAALEEQHKAGVNA